ncbi:hypothetical protein [Devosia oryzisoli]|nr:hypothetical protein [Devosia oryzisoli]
MSSILAVPLGQIAEMRCGSTGVACQRSRQVSDFVFEVRNL